MSAPPFFQSAGRGDLKFWGEDDKPTVVVWERLWELEQEQWSEKMGKSKDWVVWCRSKEKDEQQRPFEVNGKEIFSNRSKQAKPKAGEKTDKKASEAKGNQFAGKRGGDRAPSNVQGAKSMPRAGFTKIAMWQTSTTQR